jgi:hypothetical protein
MTDPDQIYPPGVVHIARSEVDEDILDHQVQNCPKCENKLEQGFGMAGGGYGAHGYCTVCDRIRWKVTFND